MKLSLLTCVLLVGCASRVDEGPHDATYLFQSKEEYEAVCKGESGQKNYIVTHTLTWGYTRTAESGGVPVVGGKCPIGVWDRVTILANGTTVITQ